MPSVYNVCGAVPSCPPKLPPTRCLYPITQSAEGSSAEVAASYDGFAQAVIKLEACVENDWRDRFRSYVSTQKSPGYNIAQ